MRDQRWIAAFGRRDEPTDALKDYFRFLAAALHPKGCSLELHSIAWAELGWRRALSDLDKCFLDQRPAWALVRYTALSWSRRGYPIRSAPLIRCVKRGGVRVAVVYRDPQPFAGSRLRDRVRRKAQMAAMRESARLADRILTTISPDCVPWMQGTVGARWQQCFRAWSSSENFGRGGSAVGCRFRRDGGRKDEAALIAQVMLRASARLGWLRLIVFGRGAKLAEATLRETLDGSAVDLDVPGIVSFEQACALLAGVDVQLFVRGELASNRGSTIAGIACGLPIVGFSGKCTAFPITEAGVRLVPLGQVEALVQELVPV